MSLTLIFLFLNLSNQIILEERKCFLKPCIGHILNWFLCFNDNNNAALKTKNYYIYGVIIRILTNKLFIFTYSISDVRLESRAENKSSLSVESGGSSAGHSRGLAWTPPASVEGSTPTWTEGTPSFTESSSSGDMGKEKQL